MFGDLATPIGLILNHNNPRECFVIFPDSEYVPDILKLGHTPQWVGTQMNLTLDRPKMEVILIIDKILEDKTLEEGEEYEYIPIEADESPHFSTPKNGEEPVISQFAEHIKSLQTYELKQILVAISQEMDARHVPHRSPSKPDDASGSKAHEVSFILHSLIKEGALRTNIPKLSVFSGDMMKGEASFEQWSYELYTLRKTYSESALREGIQRSLKGATADTVHNMGPDASLDTIIKKFSIIYENVKFYDILMRDFYRADQGVEETVTSFATRIEGLLSQVRDKFPNQIPLYKEQEVLKDRLLHGCQKSIRDTMKYCHADTSVDYMTFLEECRKAEDEDRAGKSKIKGKLKVATATIPSTQSDVLAKQLIRLQHQFDTLMGKMQSMIVTLQSQTAQASTTFRQGSPSFGMWGRGRTTNNDKRGGP